MGFFCFLGDRELSRYLDGELPAVECERLRTHLGSCPRCESRLEAFRLVDGLVSGGLRAPALRPAPSRLVIAVAVAAALVASLAANLLLPPEPAARARGALFTVPAAPSQALAGLYGRLSGAGDVLR